MNKGTLRRYKLTGSSTRLLRGPDQDEILGRLLSLPRGDGYLVLENLDHPQHYIQVLHESSGLFRLEVRDGGPERHVMARTLSAERVADGFVAWMSELAQATGSSTEGSPRWREDFTWQDISAEFTAEPTDGTEPEA
ncbi:hypothetical protein [Angustibacter luteus]|uniref:DUF4265 domain-containing protein n=1 Tax=Angustibacter luteus TaxID=658456 RepID=A0ABW1JHY9_9ACTN